VNPLRRLQDIHLFRSGGYENINRRSREYLLFQDPGGGEVEPHRDLILLLFCECLSYLLASERERRCC
jgi:hypothetical protein